jgi:hypothetical protein
MRPFKLNEAYTAPKGAFIIPDIVSACHQGFTDGKAFDPDRFRCACVCYLLWVCVCVCVCVVRARAWVVHS